MPPKEATGFVKAAWKPCLKSSGVPDEMEITESKKASKARIFKIYVLSFSSLDGVEEHCQCLTLTLFIYASLANQPPPLIIHHLIPSYPLFPLFHDCLELLNEKRLCHIVYLLLGWFWLQYDTFWPLMQNRSHISISSCFRFLYYFSIIPSNMCSHYTD